MSDGRDGDSPMMRASAGGFGCLAGIGTAVAVPAIVFCGILIANALNPQCGTPADSGGCEMGLASGTIAAVVIGLVLGVIVAVAATALWPRKR